MKPCVSCTPGRNTLIFHAKPYQNKPQLYNYVFIPLPPLGEKFIHRFDPETSAFTTFSPGTGYADFPILPYHAHPFCAIINALPKLKKYSDVLPPYHQDLLGKMFIIEAAWREKLESASTLPRGFTRTRDDQDDSDSEEGEDSHQDKRRRTDPGKGKGKDKAEWQREKRGDNSAENSRKSSRRKPALGAQGAVYPSPPHSDDLDLGYYNQSTNVASWREKVIAIKRPRKITQGKINWAFHEPTRAPFTGDWHEYSIPWNRPSDHSQFSSIDWALQHQMFLLTGPVMPWDEDDYWDSTADRSSDSDASSCHSFSS